MTLDHTDDTEKKRQLAQLIGIEDRVWIQVEGSSKLYSIADEDVDRENDYGPSTVHFLRFELTKEMKAAPQYGVGLAVGVDHPRCQGGDQPLPQTIRNAGRRPGSNCGHSAKKAVSVAGFCCPGAARSGDDAAFQFKITFRKMPIRNGLIDKLIKLQCPHVISTKSCRSRACNGGNVVPLIWPGALRRPGSLVAMTGHAPCSRARNSLKSIPVRRRRRCSRGSRWQNLAVAKALTSAWTKILRPAGWVSRNRACPTLQQ